MLKTVSAANTDAIRRSVRRRGLFPFLAGLFLICMCVLMLQIVETRIISVIVYYHLAFFAISMAMLGMTAGSLLVYFRSDLFSGKRLFENLAWLGSAIAISIVLSTLSLITTVTGAGVTNTYVMTGLVWLKLIVILLPPYVLAGMAISLALTRSPWRVGLVYGVDLMGAAFGCLSTLALLSWADAISALFAVAAFAAIAAFCFGIARKRFGETGPPLLAISRLGHRGWAAGLAVAFGAIAVGNAALQPTTQAKQVHDGLVLLLAKDQPEFVPPTVMRWNTYSRIMVRPELVLEPYMWGPSPLTPSIKIPQRVMNIDGAAATAMYKFDGDISKLDFLRYDVTNLAYSIRFRGRSAVIGVGGGRDLLSAYLFGFRDVTGVELNPIFVDFLTREFRDYNHLADLPGIHLNVDDARSWFARTHEKFDLIQMSLVDTWASTGAGAFSLSENGLYTAQGWRHFLDALTPSGVFTVSRWFDPNDISEIGRLVSLAAASLRDQGVDDPQTHMFVGASDKLATLIVSKAPFTAEELAQLRTRTENLKFQVILSPDRLDPSHILTQIVQARTPDELASLSQREHVDLSVTTDDRPFFFMQLNALDLASVIFAFKSAEGVVHGNLLATMTLMLIMAFSAVLVLFTMIFPALPSIRRTPKSLARLGTLYFMLIGCGFMFVEIGLIQRLSTFLGHPVYGLAIGLFGIILSTGVGSLLSERFPLSSTQRVVAWAALLGTYLVLLPFWFPSLVAAFEGGSLPMRAAVSLAAIVPSGVLMGFGFPTGMRLAGEIDTRPTPWFWAVNGAAGVLAASLAVATSITFSIDVSLWVAAACYFLIAPIGVGLASLSRPSAEESAVPATV